MIKINLIKKHRFGRQHKYCDIESGWVLMGTNKYDMEFASWYDYMLMKVYALYHKELK